MLCLILTLVLIPTGLWAQELDCAAINFFGPACVRVVPVPPSAGSPDGVAASREPLFTQGTVAPGTPEVAIKALNEPTLANVRAWKHWRQQRLDRALRVQQMLDVLDPPRTGP